MKLFFLTLFSLFFYSATILSQSPDSSFIISLNQQTDNYVVSRDTAALNNIYASDFVFSHGSGRIEGKKGWFSSVVKGNFISRLHDSVTVEMHKDLAIVRGNLSIQKKNKETTDSYHLKYVRVFAYRNKKWVLISHITTNEYHEP